ncbi:hypothetical protein CA982_17870 [Gordonia lacunae]|uniref:Uncharacterized protein n=1 Tax=Gordonia lacunae TaxID=417102 RepID=A0A243Q6Z0_9ACTN|nr:hypothetical protein CA982_17870 [Gordonia lacunae]
MPEFTPSQEAQERGGEATQAIAAGARRSSPGLFELVVRELKGLDPAVSDEVILCVYGLAVILSRETS